VVRTTNTRMTSSKMEYKQHGGQGGSSGRGLGEMTYYVMVAVDVAR
jgi:hypothetical protein